jgi:hypothetical protein
MPYQKEIKSIKYLKKRSKEIRDQHEEIGFDLENIKEDLELLSDSVIIDNNQEFDKLKQIELAKMSLIHELKNSNLEDIFSESEALFPSALGIDDLLSREDYWQINHDISQYLNDFNKRYNLDKWDYALAGSCGLFAAMLDILLVRAPAKPTTPWNNKVNGIFNEAVRKAFNKVLPIDKSKELCKKFVIGAPDSSVPTDLIGEIPKRISPFNHRLRSLAHDPLFGFLFGILDMRNGTCTIVEDGHIKIIKSIKGSTNNSLFYQFGRMLGHLLSDVNAPSLKGNRGMGLPAPFMGLLRMLNGNHINNSDFSKQIEWMYLRGYDFRQFVTSSIPMTAIEVFSRLLYAAKQVKVNKGDFWKSLLETMPFNVSPKFRMILAMSYGVSSTVNAGKVYITKNILDLNYASWMGLIWNGFHALKWITYNKHYKFWTEVERNEILKIDSLVGRIQDLKVKSGVLPIG